MSINADLTAKQLIFCKEYAIDMNATKAAIRAGYSERSADTQGSRMLRNVKVRAYLDKQLTERADKLDITSDRVLKEIARIAFFDTRKIFTGNVINQIDTLDDDTALAISSFKVRVEKQSDGDFAEVIEVKSNDKLKALDMLGRHLGLFEKSESKDISENSKTSINIMIDD